MNERCGLCKQPTDTYFLPKIYVTECDHAFHINCIANWTKNNEICPNCGSFINHNFSLYYKHLSRFWILLSLIIFLPCWSVMVINLEPNSSYIYTAFLSIILLIIALIFTICIHVRQREYKKS